MAITDNAQIDHLLGNAIGIFHFVLPKTSQDYLFGLMSTLGYTERQIANIMANSNTFTEVIISDRSTIEEKVAVLMDHYHLTENNVPVNGVPVEAVNEAQKFFTSRIKDPNFGFGDIAVEATHFLLATSDISYLNMPEFNGIAETFQMHIKKTFDATQKFQGIENPEGFGDLLHELPGSPSPVLFVLTIEKNYNSFVEANPNLGLSPINILFEVLDPTILASLDPGISNNGDPFLFEAKDTAIMENLDPNAFEDLDSINFEASGDVIIEILDSDVFEDMDLTDIEIIERPIVFSGGNKFVSDGVSPTDSSGTNLDSITGVTPAFFEGINPVLFVNANQDSNLASEDDMIIETLGASPLSVDNFVI